MKPGELLPLGMTELKPTYALVILLLAVASCSGMWGDHSLGDNFSLLGGDRIEDRIIVYCNNRDFGVCVSGTYVVPEYARHFSKDGRYVEYVEMAKANDKFIIARTIQVVDKKLNYWIVSKDFKVENCTMVDCDSLTRSHVTGPMNYSQFQKTLTALDINLRFDED